jgi:hypothetical protein
MIRTAEQIKAKLATSQLPVERQAQLVGILGGSESVRYGTPVVVERGAGKTAPNGQAFDVKIAASTETIARDSGIIPLSAWERGGLANFVRNPVILAFHSHRDPIGISVFTELDGNALVEYWKFHEETQLSREMKALYEGGWLRAASVGFIVTEFAFIDELPKDEYDKLVQKYGASTLRDAFWIAQRAELLETSAVPVPSDPNALQFSAGMRSAVASGIQVSEIKKLTDPEETRMPEPELTATPEPSPEPQQPQPDEREALITALTERIATLETTVKDLRSSLDAVTERVTSVETTRGGSNEPEPVVEIALQDGESKEDGIARFVDELINTRLGAPSPKK